jgi:O-antigen/teichoic acid export membrane protein
MTGSGVASVIPIFLSIILTRLYSPENYGSFAIFLSTASLLSMLVTIQYCSAILLPAGDTTASHVALLSLLITLVVAVSVAIVLLILAVCDVAIIRHGWLLPISLIFSGCNAILMPWSNRLKRYRVSSRSKITSVVAAGAVQLLLGSVYPSSFGLIVGYLCGQIAMAAVYLWSNKSLIGLIHANIPSVGQLKGLSLQYKNFLLLATPSAIVEAAISNLPIYAFALLYTGNDIGYLGLTLRILLGPVNILSMSVSQVFGQKAVEDGRKTGTCRPLFQKTLLGLCLMGLPVFAVISMFGPDLFSFAFGGEWATSGQFARPMAIMFFFKFISAPLLFVFYLANRQKQFFLFNITALLVSCLGMLYTSGMQGGASMLISVYAITSSISFLILLFFAYHHSGNRLSSIQTEA